jgi:hypothetical protein
MTGGLVANQPHHTRLAAGAAPALRSAEVRAGRPAIVIWRKVAGILIVGYLSMTRSFAYLGVPPLFIGEIVLGAFVLLKPRVALGTLATSLLRRSPLSALSLAFLVFILYGIWQVGRGVLEGSSLLYALKFFVFNYYAIYLFYGIWIGLQYPGSLRKLVRAIALVSGIYSLIWMLLLKDLMIYLPGSHVALFGVPSGGAVAILGLLCFERDLRVVWPVLALNIMVTLALQARASWLGVAVGMLVWGLLTGRLGRILGMGLVALAVIGMIELSGLQLGVGGRAISMAEVLGRVVAPIDLELAKELTPNATKHASTAEWRELWWERIWISVHSAPMLEAFGHGYGFDLFGLAPESVRGGQEEWDVRTPHSVFYYALGYTGWIGVILFAGFQFTILRLAWRAYRLSGQTAAVVFWAMGIAMACFEAGFETPYKAIPFYLLVGMAMEPALQSKEGKDARSARAQLLQVARW